MGKGTQFRAYKEVNLLFFVFFNYYETSLLRKSQKACQSYVNQVTIYSSLKRLG